MFSKWKIFYDANKFLDAEQIGHRSQQSDIGSLKTKPDRRAPMVEYQSITPWVMFVNARLHRDIVYPMSKIAQQIHRDGLLDIIFQVRHSWL